MEDNQKNQNGRRPKKIKMEDDQKKLKWKITQKNSKWKTTNKIQNGSRP